MANPNAKDNTQLGSGELVSNESIDSTSSRRDPNQPVVEYKLPRGKVAVGPYGQDWGDASQASPLEVHSFLERREMETMSLMATMVASESLRSLFAEKNLGDSFDSRGFGLESRGRR